MQALLFPCVAAKQVVQMIQINERDPCRGEDCRTGVNFHHVTARGDHTDKTNRKEPSVTFGARHPVTHGDEQCWGAILAPRLIAQTPRRLLPCTVCSLKSLAHTEASANRCGSRPPLCSIHFGGETHRDSGVDQVSSFGCGVIEVCLWGPPGPRCTPTHTCFFPPSTQAHAVTQLVDLTRVHRVGEGVEFGSWV